MPCDAGMTRPSPRVLLLSSLIVCTGLTADAQAQLLPGLQPLPSTVCSLTSLPATRKLDTALQLWVRSGSQGERRIIASAVSGQLAALNTLVATLTGSLLGDLPGVNATIAEVNAAALSVLACSPAAMMR